MPIETTTDLISHALQLLVLIPCDTATTVAKNLQFSRVVERSDRGLAAYEACGILLRKMLRPRAKPGLITVLEKLLHRWR